MQIFTIGFTQTTAEHFFGRLRDAGVGRVLDIRLNTTSQLAGFAKAADLAYFLRVILGVSYEHEPLLAPTPELLERGRGAKTAAAWTAFARDFDALMVERAISTLDRAAFATPTALLCSEATADRCHRRLVATHLAERWGDVEVVDL